MFQKNIHRIICGLCAAMLLGLASDGIAQDDQAKSFYAPEFRYPPQPDPDGKAETSKQRRERRAAEKKIRANIKDATNRTKAFLDGTGSPPADMGKFFNGYVFAGMKVRKPGPEGELSKQEREVLSSLGSRRAEFLGRYVKRSEPGRSRNILVDTVTLPAMQAIATDKTMHDAVRHNAMMIIGMLDMRDASGSADILPAPSPNAAQFLISQLDSDEPLMRVAAMTGISRHIAVGSKPPVADKLIAIASQPGKGSDIDYWMKRRAIQSLGTLKTNAAFASLRNVLKDKDAGTWQKFDAIEAINKIELKSVADADVQGLAYDMGQFLASDYDYLSKKLENEVDSLIFKNIVFANVDLLTQGTNEVMKGGRGDNLSMGGGGSMSRDGGEPQNSGKKKKKKKEVARVELANYHINAVRSRVKIISNMVLNVHNQGLQGRLQDQGEKDFAADLKDQLVSVIKSTDVGIVNLDEKKDDMEEDDEELSLEDEKGYTQAMIDILADASKDLREYMGLDEPEKDAEASADAEADPTQVPEAGTPNGN